MNTRLVLPAVACAAALLLAACGTSDDDEPQSTPTSAATSATPTPAADLVGDWADPAADWTVHFAADGTFVMDYQGAEEFLTGTYTLQGTQVSLVGGDGETDKGTVKGDGLVFRLGTLTRVAE